MADFTNQSFDLDTILQQAQVAAGSTNLSDVRVKFQQYDNYQAAIDGREFDGVKRPYVRCCLVKSIRAGWCIRARSAAALPKGNDRISWLNWPSTSAFLSL